MKYNWIANGIKFNDPVHALYFLKKKAEKDAGEFGAVSSKIKGYGTVREIDEVFLDIKGGRKIEISTKEIKFHTYVGYEYILSRM